MIFTLHSLSNRIGIRGNTYPIKDKLSAIPGARWDFPKGCRMWTYPLTTASLKNIQDAIENLNRNRNGVDPIQLTVDEFSRKDIGVLKQNIQFNAEARKFKDQDYTIAPLPFESKSVTPWRHQLAAFWFTENLPSALLWIGMGGGKSFISLSHAYNKGYKRIIICCRKKAVDDVWRDKELPAHYPADYIASASVHPSVKSRLEDAKEKLAIAQSSGLPFFLIVNHAAIWRTPLAEWVQKQNFEFIIIDECHKVSSQGAKINKFLQKLNVRNRLAMSGTPFRDKHSNAYGLFRILDPGVFGTSFLKFRDYYFEVGGFNNYEIKGFKSEEKREEFNKRVASITFFADDSVIDLPPVRILDVDFDLPEPVMKLYKKLRDQHALELSEGVFVTAQHAFTKRIRLQQLASGFLVTDPELTGSKYNIIVQEEKKTVLTSILEDIDAMSSVVVFYKFTPECTIIQEACEEAGRKYFVLSGKINELAQWKWANDANVLIVQISCGGDSIDLTKADYGIYYSLADSLSDYQQSVRRLRRPPKKKSVTFYRLKAKGTVDIDISTGLEIKAENIQTLKKESSVL